MRLLLLISVTVGIAIVIYPRLLREKKRKEAMIVSFLLTLGAVLNYLVFIYGKTVSPLIVLQYTLRPFIKWMYPEFFD